MPTCSIHPGVVKARNVSVVGPVSGMFYTVTVSTPSGDVDVPNVRPWMTQWPDDVHAEPYPLSTEVFAIQRGNEWRFFFPGQVPKRVGCT